MCVVGKVGKVKKKFVVFAVYLPPSLKSQEYDEICEALTLEIAAARVSYGDPVIIVCGDLNHRDLGGALNGDLHLLSPPRQGEPTHWISSTPTSRAMSLSS